MLNTYLKFSNKFLDKLTDLFSILSKSLTSSVELLFSPILNVFVFMIKNFAPPNSKVTAICIVDYPMIKISNKALQRFIKYRFINNHIAKPLPKVLNTPSITERQVQIVVAHTMSLDPLSLLPYLSNRCISEQLLLECCNSESLAPQDVFQKLFVRSALNRPNLSLFALFELYQIATGVTKTSVESIYNLLVNQAQNNLHEKSPDVIGVISDPQEFIYNKITQNKEFQAIIKTHNLSFLNLNNKISQPLISKIIKEINPPPLKIHPISRELN